MTRDVNVIISPLVNKNNNVFLNELKKYDINIVDSDSNSEMMFIFLGECKYSDLDFEDWYFLKRDYKINCFYDIETAINYSKTYVIAINDDGKLYFRDAVEYDDSDDTIKLDGHIKLFVEDFLKKEFFLKEGLSSCQSSSQKLKLLL